MEKVSTPPKPTARGCIMLICGALGLTAALCTVFAFAVTVALAWTEHTQVSWPLVTARVDRCALEIYSHRKRTYWINCSVAYEVGGQEVTSQVHSRSTPDPQRVIVQYPQGQFQLMQDWVDAHPAGTPITVHYDPTNPGKSALVETDMPLGGPQTPDNLKLLGFFALTSVLMLGLAKALRPRASSLGTLP